MRPFDVKERTVEDEMVALSGDAAKNTVQRAPTSMRSKQAAAWVRMSRCPRCTGSKDPE